MIPSNRVPEQIAKRALWREPAPVRPLLAARGEGKLSERTLRLPGDFDLATLAAADGRFGWNRKLHGVRALVRPGYFNQVDLRFFFPARDFDERQARAAASRATETLLGKKTLARWIGDIEVEPLAAACGRLIGLEKLPAAVKRLIEETESELPDRPWHELARDVPWSVVEGEPEQAEDYAGQRDLVAGITALALMWQNARSRIAFDSARYSRCGERFCYLKMDGAAGWEYSRFVDREQIERAIDAALREARLGCVVGGGTGLRYSYIELALTDVAGAWRRMSDILVAGRLPKRTWLLFHDAELSARRHGLYDDTPSPP